MPINRQQAPKQGTFVSLDPNTFTSGGLLDDADVKVTEAAFTLWDYNGAVPQKNPALGIHFDDGSEKGTDQYFSAGDVKYFVPSEDGEYLVPVGDKTSLTSSCNAATFLTSLVNAGFPAERLAGPISVLVGLECHVVRQAQQKRSGLQQAQRADGREQTILVVDRIDKLPWEKEAAPAKKGLGKAAAQSSKSNGKAEPEEAGEKQNEVLANRVQEIVVGLLAAGPVKKAQLPGLVAKQIPADDPERQEALAMAFNDGFLKSGAGDGVWKFANGVLSLG